MNTAKAIGWSDGAKPTAPAGFSVCIYAAGLDHPRWLYVLPNGDVLVAETNAHSKPDDAKRIEGLFMKLTMKHAGAGTQSANRMTFCVVSVRMEWQKPRPSFSRGQFPVRHGAHRQ